MPRMTFRERRRAAAQRRLDRTLSRAVEVGAMTQTEANEMKAEVGVAGYLVIIEMILMIVQIIADYFKERDDEE